MLFNSLEFLLYLPIVFALFWLTPGRWRHIPLLAASYYFYMYWNPTLVFLILFTTAISYLAGILLEKHEQSQAAKRLILAVTLITCLGVLLFFKYFSFLYEVFFDLVTLLGGEGPKGYFTVLLPVGISFYTFQTASYVVDVYKGTEKAERNFLYFALFVTFFPQLVAGPIERPGDLLPQLHAEKRIRDIDFNGAFRYVLLGFFKKIALADAIGISVNSVYENAAAANGPATLLATFLFAVQIFCDFSGYSDIAVGCAKLFCVDLTENFNEPYSAQSIKEFWNRWHLSLSRWLRDYIYFPLGGSRVGAFRRAANIFIVFFVSGLWHGASYNFVIWGLLHALFQVVGGYTLPLRNRLWQKLGKAPTDALVVTLRRIGTFLLVSFTWVFFRADTPKTALTLLGKALTAWQTSGILAATAEALSLTLPMAFYILFTLCLFPIMEKLKKQDPPFRGEKARMLFYLLMLVCTAAVWIYLQAEDVGSSFIYFQF